MRKTQWLAGGLAAILAVSQAAWALPKSDKNIYYSLINKYLSEKISAQDAYEHALVGLASLALGDFTRAGRELRSGLQDLEEREETKTAPTLWVALLALQYGRLSGDKSYQEVALQICRQFAAGPRFGGLPPVESEDRRDLPWGHIVCLEDARLGAAVLKLAGEEFHAEAARLEKGAARWAHLPKNSFLLMAMPSDAGTGAASGGALKEHYLAKNLFLATDADLRGAIPAESTAALLQGCRGKLTDDRFDALRRLLYAQNALLDWMEEPEARAYRVSGTAVLESRDEWFSPERGAASRPEKGTASVCWDFFKKGWNPYSAEVRPVGASMAKAELNSAAALFEMARLHLVAGEKKAAEALAQECADRYGSDPACADIVASSWLILGKMYHDQSRAASSRLMMTSAEKLEQKRDRAFSQVQRGYATASVTDSSSGFSYVTDVIKKIYN